MSVKLARRSTGIGLLLAALVAMFTFAAPTQPALATSTGCTYTWGSQFCENVNGGGTYVSYVHSSFTGTVMRCNWDVSAEFFDVYGNWYKTYRSAIHYGCWTTNWDDIHITANMRAGFVCSTLRTNSSPAVSRCQNIY